MTIKDDNSKVSSFLLKGLLLLLLSLLTLPSFALTLEGGVTYTEETARIEAFKDVPKYLPYKDTKSFNRSLFISSINYNEVSQVYHYKASVLFVPVKVIGIVYKDEPQRLYGYYIKSNGYKGFSVRILGGDEYPIKTQNYDTQTGELLSVGILTATSEYKFFQDGKLMGYWDASTGKFINKTKLPIIKLRQTSVTNYD